MLSHLTGKPALAATTSVAALCLGLFIVLPIEQNRPGPGLDHVLDPGPDPIAAPAPTAASDPAPAISAEPAPGQPAPTPALPAPPPAPRRCSDPRSRA